jgi:aspartyl protease family protein
MLRILLLAIGLLMASLYAVDRIQQSGIAAAEKTPAAPQSSRSLGPRTVVIEASDGHYATEAHIDGREVRFLVDTGATLVALRESDAAYLGYRPRDSDYNVRIRTANGEGRGARVTLERIEVGDITVRDVEALVLRDEALGVNLLGMSFLSRVRWSHDRGELVLEQ